MCKVNKSVSFKISFTTDKKFYDYNQNTLKMDAVIISDMVSTSGGGLNLNPYTAVPYLQMD